MIAILSLVLIMCVYMRCVCPTEARQGQNSETVSCIRSMDIQRDVGQVLVISLHHEDMGCPFPVSKSRQPGIDGEYDNYREVCLSFKREGEFNSSVIWDIQDRNANGHVTNHRIRLTFPVSITGSDIYRYTITSLPLTTESRHISYNLSSERMYEYGKFREVPVRNINLHMSVTEDSKITGCTTIPPVTGCMFPSQLVPHICFCVTRGEPHFLEVSVKVTSLNPNASKYDVQVWTEDRDERLLRELFYQVPHRNITEIGEINIRRQVVVSPLASYTRFVIEIHAYCGDIQLEDFPYELSAGISRTYQTSKPPTETPDTHASMSNFDNISIITGLSMVVCVALVVFSYVVVVIIYVKRRNCKAQCRRGGGTDTKRLSLQAESIHLNDTSKHSDAV